MKKSIFYLAITGFMVGLLLIGCQRQKDKEQKELKENQSDIKVQKQNIATAEEWQTFREETNAKIKANELRIAEMKVLLNKNDDIDSIYYISINNLEKRNKELKKRITTYKNDNNSEWKSFKSGVNHDVQDLDQQLNEFRTRL